MRAVILAGGFGRRLAPLTNEVPKPLVPVAGKPILVWQIEWLKRQGVTDIVLAVGYLRHKIFEALGDGRKYGVRLFYSVEEEPLGTGGAIKNAAPYISDDVFIALNGDIITDIDTRPLAAALEKADAAIALVPLRSPYGVVEVDGEGRVMAFREKPVLEHYINAGVYAIRKEALRDLPDRGNIEETLFPKLAQQGRLRAVVYKDAFWRSIDTHKDLEEVEKMLKTGPGGGP
ncbi:nucleotidyltransferase family protein [Pyrobaculum neutrophilum]|uniref:Nucleotidyl transferase n=1 Tax=Pyrobaculum neutrophilum (strain DSM 2338 / JCM 9278 / NBRC 100436 / V24Sta) TaxID=444157 RepID=B1YCC6_PYRNV|nr:nucleotidyltransferase family protein [Pyrobaculum neutrophilum]ACB39439.1 Nucleotidyl transferase [Pyrobaculum neutrophilum V24Sta]